jgi:hypothetical protein
MMFSATTICSGTTKATRNARIACTPSFQAPRMRSPLRDGWNYWNALTKIVAIRALQAVCD